MHRISYHWNRLFPPVLMVLLKIKSNERTNPASTNQNVHMSSFGLMNVSAKAKVETSAEQQHDKPVLDDSNDLMEVNYL